MRPSSSRISDSVKKKNAPWEESFRLYSTALPKLESIISLRIFRNISSTQHKNLSGLLLVLINLCKDLNVIIHSQVYYALLLIFFAFV